MKETVARHINFWAMSLGIFLVYTAFYTMGHMQAVIIESAQDSSSLGYVHGFDGDGFVSLTVVYLMAAASSWLAPVSSMVIGLKFSMVLGAVTNVIFLASFYSLSKWMLYTASAMVGLGTTILWVAQGVFLTLNSKPEDLDGKSGLFGIVFQSAGIVGNSVSYVQFGDSHDISPGTRKVFISILVALSLGGVMVLLCTVPMPWAKKELKVKKSLSDVVLEVKETAQLLCTSQMLQLAVYITYTGFIFTFWSGVYGPSLGFTQSFENPYGLAGMHGIMVSVGNFLAAITFTLLGGFLANKLGRWPIVSLGIFSEFVSFVFIFMNMPKDASFGETTEPAAVLDPSSPGLAMVASLLLGFGDGLMATQNLALIGSLYRTKAIQAFTVLRFVQHGSIAVAFSYAGFIDLYWQLGIMWILGLLALGIFIKIDLQTRKRGNKDKLFPPERDQDIAIYIISQEDKMSHNSCEPDINLDNNADNLEKNI